MEMPHMETKNSREKSKLQKPKMKKPCRLTTITKIVIMLLSTCLVITLFNMYLPYTLRVNHSLHMKDGVSSGKGRSGAWIRIQPMKYERILLTKSEVSSGKVTSLQQMKNERIPTAKSEDSIGKVTRQQQMKNERLSPTKSEVSSGKVTSLQQMKNERITPAKSEVSSGKVTSLQQMKNELIPPAKSDVTSGKGTRNSPVVWVTGQNLENVKIVFERLGFVVTTSGQADWDVLWMFDYPFYIMSKLMLNLKPYQRVNHFPGSRPITRKETLVTLELDAIPKAFRLPTDKDKLLTYAQKNPSVKWVQKNNNHRGIKIQKIEELDLKSTGTFVQKFIDKPYLIDGRMFDIGVFAIMTSLNPLRVYIVNDESKPRFCTKEYYPFNASDVDRYVVSSDYAPIREMPSLKDLYVDKKLGFKESFDRYMINKGINVSKIWSDIHDIIRAVYLKAQPSMVSTSARYKTSKNFFELVRFDFMLDEKLKVYLLEVNLSPNLSSGQFKEYKRLFEKIIYNVLRLTGVASMVKNHFHNRDLDTKNMQVSDKDVCVFSEWCTSSLCKQCDNMKCSMCRQCMQTQQLEDYKDAYLEHINRGSCRRMFPPEMNQTEALSWNPDNDRFGLSKYSDSNKSMYIWLIGMCRKDVTFCS